MKSPAATLDLFAPLPAAPTQRRLHPAPEAGSRAAARLLWVAIHFPDLALEALERDADERRPHAVIDGSGSAQRIAACDRAAARAGIRAGMGLNAAMALAPRLMARPRQARAEQQLLERCAAWAGQFTPVVSIEAPDALLLEVKGSLGLFDGAAALCERITTALGLRGMNAAVTLAPTARAALWFARAGRNALILEPAELTGALAELSVRSLGWSDSHRELLASMGVYSVGDCLRLPRDGWARRFGVGLLRELDQATGRAPEIRRSYRRAERFNARFEPASEISETTRLLVALEPLLEALERFLRGRQGGIRSFVIGLRHRAAAESILRLGLAAAGNDARHFFSLVRARLERHELPEPVTELRLRSGPILPMDFVSASVFRPGKAEGGEDVPRLVERLRARLGEEAVFGVCLVPEHRPEAAWRKAPIESAPQARPRLPAAASIALRPLWMLTEPEALETVRGKPCCRGPLVIESGPERIETGWWDGKDVTRDYYVARDPRGARLWIFEERRAPGGWFWHGIFG